MLDKAVAGLAYNKAGMVRTAQGNPKKGDTDISGDNHIPGIFCKLALRSRPSIEMKLMNCSAIHRDLGCEFTMNEHGYRAMPNYQAALRQAMVDGIAERQLDADLLTAQLNEQRDGA
jgi:hypothetical protein